MDMSARRFHFRICLLSAVLCLTAGTEQASCWARSADADTVVAAAAGNACVEACGRDAGTCRRPDRRIHRGYEGWERLIPTHVKVQYAGGMGLMSAGAGWDYGRRCRWETEIMAGFLPKAYSDRTHATLTVRQNYIPWSVSLSDRIALEPLSCGIYVNMISGEDYWVREPNRYPGDIYYGFTSRLRSYVYVGQRLTYLRQGESALRAITLYYELAANDLDIIAKCGNRSLSLQDILYFSFGVKLQLLR